MKVESETSHDIGTLRRSTRLLLLVAAAESAGLSPIAILRLHTLAYLSNVLAPVWEMPALDGKILKRHGGPFYPALQKDLDSLVGRGLVIITKLSHVRDDDGRWRLEGSYELNHAFADPVLQLLATVDFEPALVSFVAELAFAFAALSDDEIDRTVTQDATYSDPVIDFGNVIDFAEWQRRNFSANAANSFERLLPGSVRATPGEKLHFYLRHLRLRMHGGH